MYIADMFCFGKDADAVGVNGISGCMGVFVRSGGMFYGMHSPESVDDKKERGRKAFAEYVLGEEGNGFDPDQAEMILVANFTQRMSASDEGYDMCRRLGMRRFLLFRPEKFIAVDPTTKNPTAIWVVWQRLKTGGMELRYRPDADVHPTSGEGAPRGGHYGAFRDDEQISVSTENWYFARPPNAHGLRHHLVT